eukprot:gene16083-33776_t
MTQTTATATSPNFEFDAPGRDLESLKRSIANKLMFVVGKDPQAARPEDWLHAAAYAVRDQLVERWMTTTRAPYAQDAKRVYYLSMEFLIGRTFSNAMLAVGLRERVKQALADFGVASYFGIQTFTAGIYKAWLAMDNRIAAAQLATMLLVVVAVLLKLEQAAQKRMRFVSNRGGVSNAADAAPTLLRGKRAALAWLICAVPIALGFVLPVLFMLRPLVQGWGTLPWSQFGGWALSSIWLASLSAALATLLALLLGFAVRSRPSTLTRGTAQLASLGYAVPGAVIVVGLLIPVGWLQSTAPDLKAGYWVTATALGIVNRSVPAEELAEAAAELARRLAGLPTVAIGHMKKNLNMADHASLSEVLDSEAIHMIRTMMTDEHKAASHASLDKSAPVSQPRR